MASDSTTSAATGHSARVVLAGPAAESVELAALIEELLETVAITPHFSRIGGVRRAELLEQAATPSSGQARVWVTLSGPNLALLLFAGPSGERYLVRQVPLRSGLDELGRERIAQVLQSSLPTLLRGGAGMTAEEMRDAVEESEEAATTRQPSAALARHVVRADPPPGQAPSAGPFASPRLGLGYAAQWSGDAMRTRHGPALNVGLDGIGESAFGVGLVFERAVNQTYQTSEISIRTQTTSARFMLGGQWPLGGALSFFARAGAGFDLTRVVPTLAQASTVRLRHRLMDFTAVSRAEFGVALEVGPFVLDMGPRLDVSFADTHYDLAHEGQLRRVVTVWPALPGVQLSGAWRPWGTRTQSVHDSRQRSGSAVASGDTDSP